eukprot:193034_1
MEQTNDDLFIIGAGFCRTGTSSLQIALAKLGFKCYHMREIYKDKTGFDMSEWYKIGKMKYDLKIKHKVQSFEVNDDNWNLCGIDYEWKQIFERKNNIYNGILDTPGNAFYVEYMKYYKNYKVILSERDNGEQWYKSVLINIWPMVIINEQSWFFKLLSWYAGAKPFIGTLFVNYCIWWLIFDKKFQTDKQGTIQKYNQWNDAVKKYVPKETLLVFNVKQGWKPLCKFLNKQIPNEPFPRSNESKSMQKIIKTMRIVQVSTDGLLVVAVGIISYFVYNRFKKYNISF